MPNFIWNIPKDDVAKLLLSAQGVKTWLIDKLNEQFK